jgi:hypothetical protein
VADYKLDTTAVRFGAFASLALSSSDGLDPTNLVELGNYG